MVAAGSARFISLKIYFGWKTIMYTGFPP